MYAYANSETFYFFPTRVLFLFRYDKRRVKKNIILRLHDFFSSEEQYYYFSSSTIPSFQSIMVKVWWGTHVVRVFIHHLVPDHAMYMRQPRVKLDIPLDAELA